MDNDKKITLLIVKLNKLTQEGTLEWQSYNMNIQLGATEEMLNKVYVTSLNNKTFRLFKYRYRFYTDEDTFHWSEGYRLEFVDSQGTPEWTFPEENAISDLYDSVRYQAANINEFLDEFLDEDDLKSISPSW